MGADLCPFSGSEKEIPNITESHNFDDQLKADTFPHRLFSNDISEKAHEPRKRTKSFYFVLFFGVIPVWSVIPLSWAYVSYALYSGLIWIPDWRWRSLFALAASEVLFSIYYFCMSHYIAGPSPMATNSLAELQAAYARVLRAGMGIQTIGKPEEERQAIPCLLDEEITALDPMDPRAVDFRNFLRNWFGRVPWSSIRRENVYIWLYWSIFNETFTTMDDIPRTKRRLLDETVELLERRAGMKFPGGFNPEVSTLRLTVDPVTTAARPLVWYLVVSVVNWGLRWRLESKWHARRGTFEGLDYILRIPPDWSPSTGQRPVVFMHGLGLGLFQYAHFLETIFKAEPDRPFLVPLFPFVSQEIFHPRYLRPIGRQESAKLIGGLLKELGWVDKDDTEHEAESSEEKTVKPKPRTGVTMLSHSNGTFIHCWLLKAHPKMITRSCFVDPVVFCQWEGDLCYNFCYRPCATGIELIIKYFVGMELGVAYYIQRHFCWSSNTLWYDEIPNAHDPNKAMFILGGKDDLVNGPRVRRYLQSHGIDRGLYYNPLGRHGQALLTNDQAFSEVLKWLREPTTP
ncbi:hypothetical protein EIP91_011355 [Steccherinum ochraceum]|uniref:AB hydrolase-1 domain-containing protein n=1 Tax=Steccherinum ochraceum TaxID=92696 RepID=A0A4R0RYI0_9APHY|nr:hypothetical protein EIP91_011355 [Steccherinum ochraceum]